MCEVIFRALRNNKIARTNFVKILVVAIESQKLIKEHENTISTRGALECEYADQIISLKNELLDSIGISRHGKTPPSQCAND
jgi:hypothetical protein